MSSPIKGVLPSKNDHEVFVYPRKRRRSVRVKQKSQQQNSTNMPSIAEEEPGQPKSNPDFISLETFDKTTQDQKLTTIITSLNKLHNKFDSIHNDLYKDKDGIVARIETVEDGSEAILDDQELMKFEMSIMKGVIQKQECQIDQLLKKVDDLASRQMSSNVTISGITEGEDGN